MSKFSDFVGIDLSKDVFDAVVLKGQAEPVHRQFQNSAKGCGEFLKWLGKEAEGKESMLVCAEHTGMYQNILATVLLQNNVPLWIEMSYRIIKSSGIQRGKTDKVDALRIARYAARYHDKAVLYKPKGQVLQKISGLLKLREKLVNTRASLMLTAKEYQKFDKATAALLAEHQQQSVNAIEKDIDRIEGAINGLMKSDQGLRAKYEIATTVPGVGRVTALTLLCCTNGFQSFESPGQLASYCGVVPFEYTSGKSIKGRPRVHFMANKKLKQLLHMCALSASRGNNDLNSYYLRKTEEGKPKMLVINNVRNKIVHRICACIKESRPYVVRKTA